MKFIVLVLVLVACAAAFAELFEEDFKREVIKKSTRGKIAGEARFRVGAGMAEKVTAAKITKNPPKGRFPPRGPPPFDVELPSEVSVSARYVI